MDDKLLPLYFLTGLALVSLGLGRLAHQVLRRPFGTGLSLTRLLGNALLGNAVLLLAIGTLFHLGCTATQLRWPLLAILPILGAVGFVDVARTLRQPGLRRPAALLLFGGVVMVGLIYLPYGLTGAISSCGDTVTYPWVASWLKEHSFNTPVVADPTISGSYEIQCYQVHQLRMGATFLLAACQVLTPTADPLGVYLGCLCWGTVLNLAALYVLGRWALGFGPLASAAIGLLAGVTANPLYLSAMAGFFPQQFGTAYLVFFLALLARCARPQHQNARLAALVGLTAAALANVYGELVPVAVLVGVGVAIWMGWCAWRAGRLRDYFVFAAAILSTALMLGHLEWSRVAVALRTQTTACPGGHLPGSWTSFWSLALGVTSAIPSQPELPSGVTLTLMALASLALVGGLIRIVAKRKALPVVLALLLFGAMAVHFARVPNPFKPGELGQVWAEFKLCKWAFPIMLAVASAGWLPLVLRGRFRRLRLVTVAIALLVLTVAEVSATQASHAHYFHYLHGTNNVATTCKQTVQRLDELNIREIHYLTTSQGWWPDNYLCFRLHPRSFVNSWTKHALATRMGPGAPGEPLRPGATPLYWGNTPFPVRGTTLPGRLIALDPNAPHLLALSAPDGRPLSLPEAIQFFEVERKPISLLVWSPQAGQVEFLPNQADAASTKVVDLKGKSLTTARTPDGGCSFGATLPAGYSRVQIQPTGKTTLGVWRAAFASGYSKSPLAAVPRFPGVETQGDPPIPPDWLLDQLLSTPNWLKQQGYGVAPFGLLAVAALWTWWAWPRRAVGKVGPARARRAA